MRLTTLAFGAILAASAAASPAAEVTDLGHLKRAADAAAVALAEADPEARKSGWIPPWPRFCYRPGQICGKAKRSADALADAVERAYEVLGEEASENLNLYRRTAMPSPDALALADAQPSAEALAEADPEARKSGWIPPWPRFCYRPGQICGKVKRAASAVADALAEAAPRADALAEADPEARKSGWIPPWPRFCYRPGQICGKVRRALDDLQAAAGAAESHIDHEFGVEGVDFVLDDDDVEEK